MEKKLLKTVEEIDEWFSWIDFSHEPISFDWETTGLNYLAMEPVGISFCDGNRACYVNLEISNNQHLLQFLSTVFDSNAKFIAHNAKFDLSCCYKFCGTTPTSVFDTFTAAFLLDENRDSYKLKVLAVQDLGVPASSVQKWEEAEAYGHDSEKWYEYCFNDAIWAYGLYLSYRTELRKQSLEHLFYQVEMPFIHVLSYMERTGVLVDKPKLAELQDKVKAKILEVEDSMLELCGLEPVVQFTMFDEAERHLPINFNSPQQVMKVLEGFGIEIPVNKQNKKSLDKKLLAPLKGKHEFIDLYLDYKTLQKLYTSYIVPAWNLIDVDGRIRPSFGTAKTGRLTCVPRDSEILTRDGWKTYKDVSIGEEVMGYNILRDEYEWTQLQGIVLNENEEVGLVKSNRGHDARYDRGFLCTREHRWIFTSDPTTEDTGRLKGFIRAGARECHQRKLLQPKKSFPMPKASILTPTQAGILGWYLTDGSKVDTGKHTALQISLVKPRSIEAVDLLLSRLDQNDFTKHVYPKKGVTQFYIKACVFEPILEKVEELSPSKLILQLDEAALCEMWIAMMEGDGSKRTKASRYDRFGAEANSSKKTPEFFTLLAMALGQPLSCRRQRTKHGTEFLHYQLLTSDHLANKNYKWKPLKRCDTWCPTTANGTWVMRQGDEICITGNCSKPNLQNLPRISDKWPELNFRSIFIAEKGKALLAPDYSGQELRLLGVVAHDQVIIDAFHRNLDLHLLTANRCFSLNLSEKQLTEETPEYEEARERYDGERHKAKNGANFPIIYGTTAYGVSWRQGVSVNEAQRWIDSFFELYPDVRRAMDDTERELKERGFVTTLYGRRRRFPGYKHLNKWDKARCLRQAFNFKIQGSAADQIKIAMAKIFAAGHSIVLMVHDEVVVEESLDTIEQSAKRIQQIMENSVSFCIPFKVDYKIAANYGALK